jgi:integrase
MQMYPLDASLTLAEAGPKWLEQHTRYIKPNTLRNYRACIKLLTAFIGDPLVKDIDIGHIRAYQTERSAKAGHYLINGELSVLQMILKECGEWDRIKKFYKPMRVPKRRGGHSISADEERLLREVAFSRPKWRLAAHCMMVMLSTTMGFGELRHVRRRDVDTKRRCILVRDGAKNFYRDRTIPMNAAAYDSMCWILERWEKLGGSLESEFILPHRPRAAQRPWIFTEPMKSVNTAFNGIRKEAGLPAFRVYDCRVQAITKLLSDPKVSPQVSKEIAGHISQAMQDRYSIQQHDTKMAALEALESPSFAPVPPTAPSAAIPDQSKVAINADVIEPKDLVRTQPVPQLTNPSIQAEIDRLRAEIARLAERQSALALREHPPASRAPEKPTHPTRRRKRDSADPTGVIFHLRRSAKNLISFPTRLA